METYSKYFENHSYGIEVAINTLQQNKLMDKRFGKHINSKSNILEVGTGLGTFANFCLYKQVKNYTGIEIDPGMSKILAKHFSNYQIICDDVLHFFDHSNEKFDIIFMSHVFEYFSIDDGILLANKISHHLSPNGVWINIMPNAGSIAAGFSRYNDITHKVLYTSNSFDQVLLSAGFKKPNIQHFNVLPRNIVKKALARIIGKLLSVGYSTFELMTTITKN